MWFDSTDTLPTYCFSHSNFSINVYIIKSSRVSNGVLFQDKNSYGSSLSLSSSTFILTYALPCQVGSVAVFVMRHRGQVGGGRSQLQHIVNVIALNMVCPHFWMSKF